MANETEEKQAPQAADSNGQVCRMGDIELEPDVCEFYREALDLLERSGIDFLVGGAFALCHYTGLARHTKDFDVFVRPADIQRVLKVFSDAGFKSELSNSRWLGKAFKGDKFIDFIFASANGLTTVDDAWFDHASRGTVVGHNVRFSPPEEMIWQKCFIQERHRYDGADVLHLIHSCASTIDWDRLVARFGENWRVLLSHLILFGFAYPRQREAIPKRIMSELTQSLEREIEERAPDSPVCQGTLISKFSYLPDVQRGGYQDARLPPWGDLTIEEVEGP